MTTLTLQPDATTGLDTYINQFDPTTNFGTSTNVGIGEDNTTTDLYRALIKFDLSSLPSNAIISSATLSLYSWIDRSSNPRTFRVYRQKRAWAESEATWNNYSTGNSWQSAGGFGANDCEQTDIGSRAFTATEGSGFKDFALTPTTKAGLDLGNGWLIKADTEADDAYIFYSSNDTTPANRPKLVIEYHIGGSFVADAVLKETQAGSFTADARLRQLSFTADAVLKETQTGSFTADAYLSESFTADAVLKETQLSSTTADAVLKETQSSSFTADGVLLETISDTLAADAVLQETQTGSFTADACFTSDAVSSKQYLFTKAGPIHIPVFPFQPISVSVTSNHTADYREIVFCDATSGSLTVTLPEVADNLDKVYTIKHTSGSHSVTVRGTGGDTIDDETSQTLNRYDALKVVSDSSEWWII